MKVKVKFFGSHRSAVGKDEMDVEIEDGIDVDGMIRMLIRDYPELERLMNFTTIALNKKIAGGTNTFRDGDELALFPPIAGG